MAAIVLLVSGLLACRENTDPDEARELRDRVEAEGYRSWSRVPGFETRRESHTAHGTSVEIYWNRVAEGSARARPFSAMAPGSILVKEAYVDNALKNLAVMEKRFDGWFWAEWEPGGDVLFSGRPGVCIDCHRSGDDFLRSISPSEGR
ncbi:MAG TPA: hypothetical protein VM580_20135 [Labilithrix sp.]|nr:hypothetical protein [Labilithrix sp.]